MPLLVNSDEFEKKNSELPLHLTLTTEFEQSLVGTRYLANPVDRDSERRSHGEPLSLKISNLEETTGAI